MKSSVHGRRCVERQLPVLLPEEPFSDVLLSSVPRPHEDKENTNAEKTKTLKKVEPTDINIREYII
jgi:hypothetical protein